MLRQLTALLLALTLCFTTAACGSNNRSQSQPTQNKPTTTSVAPTQIAPGRYPVQQASYNDGDGTYTLMLLNTPAGSPPVYTTTNLQMARLTDEAISKGEKSYLEVEGDNATLYLTEDFKIEYLHAVTETRDNPQTGERETVVIRQESNFWSPFAGALAGQAIGSLLFSPRYYVPPIYQPGTTLRGYGGVGTTYGGAVREYQSRHNAPPPAVKNRQVLRTTGNLRKTSPTVTKPRTGDRTTKSTGSGYGSSRLRTSGNSRSQARPKSSSGFGSSSRRSPSMRSGGRRR
jgi:hypothetical protein